MPVHELPHGRRVGWWGLDVNEKPQDEGWIATPVEISSTRCRWRMESGETSGSVVEVLASEEIVGLEDVLAVRVPGWASRGLRPGSPAGLLVTRIAEAASWRGRPCGSQTLIRKVCGSSSVCRVPSGSMVRPCRGEERGSEGVVADGPRRSRLTPASDWFHSEVGKAHRRPQQKAGEICGLSDQYRTER